MFRTASAFKLAGVCVFLLWLASCNEDTIDPKGEGSITGTVISAGTNQTLAAVSITTNPASSALITDAGGSFLLPAMPAGEYSITAKKTGYKPESVLVAVREGQQTSVTLVLEKAKDSNGGPKSPAHPSPAPDTLHQAVNVTLKWSGSDPDQDDSLTYDVFLYQAGAMKKMLAEGIRDTSVLAADLQYNTTYFWQVKAKDAQGNVTLGEVWSFTTMAIPDTRYLFTRVAAGNYDIYSADGTEAGIYRLTTAFHPEWWPLLNPRRDIIAYASQAGVQPQIYTMNRDGSGKRQVTTIPIAGYHNPGIGFAWSPDGGQLLYPYYEQLYRIERDGSGLTLVAKAPANRHFRMVDWTDRGHKIVAQTIGSNINDSEIYIMNEDGTDMKLLVENLAGRLESPSFSIDGKDILFSHDVSGFENPEGRQLNAHIFMKKIDGSGSVDLSASKPAGTNDLYPRFSPDGSKVIFVNTSNDGLQPADVWVVDVADGRNRTKLFPNATMPEWK
jgi:TolB protein